jgi:hypothetical protein
MAMFAALVDMPIVVALMDDAMRCDAHAADEANSTRLLLHSPNGPASSMPHEVASRTISSNRAAEEVKKSPTLDNQSHAAQTKRDSDRSERIDEMRGSACAVTQAVCIIVCARNVTLSSPRPLVRVAIH